MRSLSIRQPYAEEILLRLKRIEYRSRRVSDNLIGERFYIYAAMGQPTPADMKGFVKRDWISDRGRRKLQALPRGVIVGTAIISHCTPSTRSGLARGRKYFEWHLTDVKRLKRPRKPKNKPQPVWFTPF